MIPKALLSPAWRPPEAGNDLVKDQHRPDPSSEFANLGQESGMGCGWVPRRRR